MIRRVLPALAAPVAAVLVAGPLVARIARRLTRAPRRLPGEAALGPALDALGGEVVRLRSRDGLALSARWLDADRPVVPGPATRDGSAVGGTGDGAWVPDPHEAVLLLHGYSGSVAPDLVELGPVLRRTAGVLGLDFRGHGGSDDGPTTFGLLEIEDVAGALAWLGQRGVRRVALVGSSMGGITAIAAAVVLGDGRLTGADTDPDAPAAAIAPPTPLIVAIVGDSVTPELWIVVANRMHVPFPRLLAEAAFARLARDLGGDPRATQPIAMVGLLEDVPLLLVHGEGDLTVPIADGNRLAAAAPPGSRHLVVPGAGHAAAHATDPARYEAAVTGLLREAFADTRT